MKIFHVGSHQFRESLRELLRELWLSHCSSRETPFREWDFSFRDLFFELRELLREYPGTLPELREWPFRSESVFPEIGVVPRLLTSDKKKTEKRLKTLLFKFHFRAFLSHLGFIAFESLSGRFSCFGILGSVDGVPGHNT